MKAFGKMAVIGLRDFFERATNRKKLIFSILLMSSSWSDPNLVR